MHRDNYTVTPTHNGGQPLKGETARLQMATPRGAGPDGVS